MGGFKFHGKVPSRTKAPGIGKKSAVNPYQPVQMTRREPRGDYVPPLGRLKGANGGRLRIGERIKVVQLSREKIEPTGTAGPLQQKIIDMQMAECHLINGALTVPNVPDFYRAIDGWHHFLYTGMKLEISVIPRMHVSGQAAAGGVAALIIECRGRCWTQAEDAPENVGAMTQTAVTPIVVNGTFIEGSAFDPSFRPATFHHGLTTTSSRSGLIRPFVKRYVRANPEKALPSTPAGALPLNWNIIRPSGTPLVTAPIIDLVQKDSRLTYKIDDLYFAANSTTDTPLLYYLVKKTWYLRVRERHPPDVATLPSFMLQTQEPDVVMGAFTAATEGPDG